MKAPSALFLFAFLIPAVLYSHEIPVSPVSIQFHVESSQIRAHISMEADYWMVEVLGLSSPPPPTDWVASLQEESARVIDDSLALAVDGTPLKRVALQCRYVEEPMRLVPSRFEFFAIYEMPEEGESLTGRVQFFKEEYTHYIRAQRPIDQSFVSHLQFSGRSQNKLDLPFERPEFQFDLADLRKTPKEYFFEAFHSSLLTFLFGSLLPIFCLAVFLSLRFLPSFQRILAGGVLVLCAVTLSHLSLGAKALGPSVMWAHAALLSCALLWRGRHEKFQALACMIIAIKVLPSFYNMALAHLPFSAEASGPIKWGILSALLISGIVLSGLFRLVEVFHQRTLNKNYGETAPRLFLFDVRALSGFLLFISLMQMIKFQILK